MITITTGIRDNKPKNAKAIFSENDIDKIEALMRSIIEKQDAVTKETWDRERALNFYKEK